MWLQLWKAVSQISIWLAKKTAFTIRYSLICFVRQKYGWKGNCFNRRVKTLKYGWHPLDAGELALFQYNKINNNSEPISFNICKSSQLWYSIKIKKHLEIFLNQTFITDLQHMFPLTFNLLSCFNMAVSIKFILKASWMTINQSIKRSISLATFLSVKQLINI